MVLQAKLISKGYHSLDPGLISIFLETVWVPLRNTLRTLDLNNELAKSILFFLYLAAILTLLVGIVIIILDQLGFDESLARFFGIDPLNSLEETYAGESFY